MVKAKKNINLVLLYETTGITAAAVCGFNDVVIHQKKAAHPLNQQIFAIKFIFIFLSIPIKVIFLYIKNNNNIMLYPGPGGDVVFVGVRYK